MLILSEQKKTTPEVFFPSDGHFHLGKSVISELIESAKVTERQRSRLCVHPSDDALVQQMFIVHPGGAYVRPHRHNNKTESILILQGEVDYLSFTGSGELAERVELSDYQSGYPFFQMTPPDLYHSLIIKTRWLVFVEVTGGPFLKVDSNFAPWSPEDDDAVGIECFFRKMETL